MLPVSSLVRGCVIVVDDDPAVRNALGFMLEIEGFAVEMHGSGMEFLDAPRAVGPACLIIDNTMPGMNGLDVVTELRRRGDQLPAIMVTATKGAALTHAARAAGIVRVFEKPLFGDGLVKAVRELLSRPARKVRKR